MTRNPKNLHGLKATVTSMIEKNVFGKIKNKTTLTVAWLCACAVLALLCGILWYLLWKNGAFLPRWIQWENGSVQEASGEYKIVLTGKSVCVYRRDSVIWTSPEEVKVQKALSCDVDNDGQEELVLLCWKRGRYGRLKPVWVEKDEQDWSQHIFVYEYDHTLVRPKWMSSYIGFDVSDIASNQKQAPFGRLWLTDTEGKRTVWVWDSWGFSKEDSEISIVAFGDLLAHEPIYRYGLSSDEGFDFLFENMEEVIEKSDIAVINQETPLVDDPSIYGDYPRFGTPAQVGQAIADAGFDVVTCATNHALDRGAEGVNFTKHFFDDSRIQCLGIQAEDEEEYRAYEIVARSGVSFALLNYTYGTNGIRLPKESPNIVHLLEDEEKIRGDIEKARQDADIVIVFVHWGTEYQEEPDEYQRKWAGIFLDSGVDIVIGTHPHVLQPCEVLTDDNGHSMLIYYSLGNFISAQSEKTCVRGGMAEITLSLTSEGLQVTAYDLKPLKITWQTGGKYTVDMDLP